ncbi:hypothetical protein V6N00_13785 [Tersicoccus sp. MR15.9]|uniref:hypothetical protein n=1 Tax=Tersicoccus mangrovi TaxID=3121635 RepID=UPI002FE50D10
MTITGSPRTSTLTTLPDGVTRNRRTGHYEATVRRTPDATKAYRLAFSWYPADPEYRVAGPDGAAPLPGVRITPQSASYPAWLHDRIEELKPAVAAYEQARHGVRPRTAEEQERCGALTRAVGSEIDTLAEGIREYRDDVDQDFIDEGLPEVAVRNVLRFAHEEGWYSPSEVDEQQDHVKELKTQVEAAEREKDGLEEKLQAVEEERAAVRALLADLGDFFDGIDPAGMRPRPTGATPAALAAVWDEARHVRETFERIRVESD